MGYPASYQNFRNATEADNWIITRTPKTDKPQQQEDKSTTSSIGNIFKNKKNIVSFNFYIIND